MAIRIIAVVRSVVILRLCSINSYENIFLEYFFELVNRSQA